MNKLGIREDSFHIGRKIDPVSLGDLAFRLVLPEVFPRLEIDIREESVLSISLVERGETQRVRELSDKLGKVSVKTLINKALEPQLEGAGQTLTLPITGVAYMGKRTFWKNLCIVLGDEQDQLKRERETYLERLHPGHKWKDLNPHLTIAGVSATSAIDDILEYTAQHLPESLSFMPVEATPFVDRYAGAIK